MQVTRCDRCGNIFDRPLCYYDIDITTVANKMELKCTACNSESLTKGRYDLCIECISDLRKWLEEKKEAE